MRPKRPTRADVAALAGVAPSTVTLVLNHRGSEVGIAAATQERIKEAAKTLGYYPNFHISSVLKGRSNLIGLYLRYDQWARPFGYWPSIVWHLQAAIAETDLRLLIHNAQPNCSTEEAFARQAGGTVDGVIILNSGEDPIAQRLLDARLPAVELGDRFSSLPYVAVDGEDGVRQAVAHLAGRGRTKLACLSYNTSYEKNAQSRIEAFLEAATSHAPGLDYSQRIIRAGGEDSPVDLVLALDPVPDAVACLSDEHAYELAAGLEARGIKVPGQIAVTGFDCLPSLNPSRMATSVMTPLHKSAQMALAKLRAIIDGQPHEQGDVLPVSLRIGDTT